MRELFQSRLRLKLKLSILSAAIGSDWLTGRMMEASKTWGLSGQVGHGWVPGLHKSTADGFESAGGDHNMSILKPSRMRENSSVWLQPHAGSRTETASTFCSSYWMPP